VRRQAARTAAPACWSIVRTTSAGHSVIIRADRWSDDVRMSDIEPGWFRVHGVPETRCRCQAGLAGGHLKGSGIGFSALAFTGLLALPCGDERRESPVCRRLVEAEGKFMRGHAGDTLRQRIIERSVSTVWECARDEWKHTLRGRL
jgi:hypothetical protein